MQLHEALFFCQPECKYWFGLSSLASLLVCGAIKSAAFTPSLNLSRCSISMLPWFLEGCPGGEHSVGESHLPISWDANHPAVLTQSVQILFYGHPVSHLSGIPPPFAPVSISQECFRCCTNLMKMSHLSSCSFLSCALQIHKFHTCTGKN